MLSSQKSFKPLIIEILISENLKGFMGSVSLNFPFILFTILTLVLDLLHTKSIQTPYIIFVIRVTI
jgi:hypothetical protein